MATSGEIRLVKAAGVAVLVGMGPEEEGTLPLSVIQTREKYFLTWKEEGGSENPLDRGISQLCAKERFLELWQILRPAIHGRAAQAPRIWRT